MKKSFACLRLEQLESRLAPAGLIIQDDDIFAPDIQINGQSPTHSFQNDGQDQTFSWWFRDRSGLARVDITITQGQTELAHQVLSNLGPDFYTGSFDFNGFGLGDFKITISATDADNDGPNDSLSETVSKTVTVTDDDITGPQITVTGARGAVTDGDNPTLGWAISDQSGLGQIHVSLMSEGQEVASRADSFGQFFLNDFGLGSFSLLIDAQDADNDWPGSDSLESVTTSAVDYSAGSARVDVTVLDDDADAPDSGLSGSEGTQTDDQDQMFGWNITDGAGVASALVTIRQDGEVIHTFTTTHGAYTFDDLGPGTFSITVVATDADNDRPGDQTSSATTRTVTVVAAAPDTVVAAAPEDVLTVRIDPAQNAELPANPSLDSRIINPFTPVLDSLSAPPRAFLSFRDDHAFLTHDGRADEERERRFRFEFGAGAAENQQSPLHRPALLPIRSASSPLDADDSVAVVEAIRQGQAPRPPNVPRQGPAPQAVRQDSEAPADSRPILLAPPGAQSGARPISPAPSAALPLVETSAVDPSDASPSDQAESSVGAGLGWWLALPLTGAAALARPWRRHGYHSRKVPRRTWRW